MNPRCKPPKFDQQDWSQFDFSRWHLNGLTLDRVSETFASLSEQLFNSDEWRQNFQVTLPEVEREALTFYKNHSEQLRARTKAMATDYDRRIAAAHQRSEDFRRSLEAAAACPAVQPSPDKFHLAVKTILEDQRLGLPGLVVEIVDPRNEKIALVQAVTDMDGNAILSIPESIAKELDKHEAVLTVRGSTAKELLRIPATVCIRPNQVDTKIVVVPDDPDLEPERTAAQGMRAQRNARLETLAARPETLKREGEERLSELACKLADNEAIVAELEATQSASPGTSEQARSQGSE